MKKIALVLCFTMVLTTMFIIGAISVNAATPSLSYSSDAFTEMPANNGTLSTITVTSGGSNPNKFVTNTTTLSNYIYVYSGTVPTNLTFTVTRVDDTHITLSFTGAASSHQAINSTDIIVRFYHDAFQSSFSWGTSYVSKSFGIDFTDNPALTWPTSSFNETSANDGTITDKLRVTLSGDTFAAAGAANGTDFSSSQVSVGNVPPGLAAVVTRINSTTAEISFTGKATSHNTDTSIALTFNSSAFTSNNASLIIRTNGNLNINFTPATLTWSGTAFNGSGLDGSVADKLTVTLTGDKFAAAGGTNDNFTIGSTSQISTTNVPTGLTLAVKRLSDTTAEISFTGNAASHSSDVTNLNINFRSNAFISNDSIGVTKSSSGNLTIHFIPVTLTWPTGSFNEAGSNDGTITNKLNVTLSGDTFNNAIADGTDFTLGTNQHANVTGVPAGLTAEIKKINATTAELSLNGQALSNNSDVNITVTFYNSAFTGNNASAVVGGASKSITINFTPATLSWSGNIFNGSGLDGSVTDKLTVTLTGDKFAAAGGTNNTFTIGNSSQVSTSGLPNGLTLVVKRLSDTTAEISLTGNATSHSADVTNLNINFRSSAFASNDSAGVTGANSGNLTIHYVPMTLTWPTGGFNETDANDGTITDKLNVTLSGDTFKNTIANGTAFTLGTNQQVNVTGVPNGLTPVIKKIDETTAELSLTGQATSHNSDVNITVTFYNSAFTGNNASAVVGGASKSITINFIPATLSWSGNTFNGSGIDGSITDKLTVTLIGDKFATAGGTSNAFTIGSSSQVSATGVPNVLTLVVKRLSDTTAEISFTGNATSHSADVTNLNISFKSSAFASNDSTGVTGASSGNLTIHYIPMVLTWPTGGFTESSANDGTITNKLSVGLSGETFINTIADGDTFTLGTNANVTGVPTGLTPVIKKINSTTAEISLTGQAASHNISTSMTVTFYNSAFTKNNASAAVGGASKSIAINFTPATLTWSDKNFYGSSSDGSVPTKLTVTLSGDKFAAAGGTGNTFTVSTSGSSNQVTVTGVPGNLNISITRIDNTTAEISFTGTASSHSSDKTITITFNNSAFVSGQAGSGVTNAGSGNITIHFITNTLIWSLPDSFSETSANNGTIANKLTLTLFGDTFKSAGGSNNTFTVGTGSSTQVTVDHVPAGLTLVVTRINNNTAEVSFTGQATSHNSSITNLRVTFNSSAFSTRSASSITNSSRTNLIINFTPAAMTWPASSIFNETSANDGHIANTLTVSLTGDSFASVTNNYFSLSGSNPQITVGNVPPGLTVAVRKIDGSTAEISLTGAATSHNTKINNLTITFNNSAYLSADSSGVTDHSRNNLVINFTPATLTWPAICTFHETYDNDGHITDKLRVTLSGDTFAAVGSSGNFTTATSGSSSQVTVGNVPGGLTLVVKRIDNITAEISFTGQATSHVTDITNLTVTFNKSAFASGDATGVIGASRNDLVIDFIGILQLTYESGAFTEAKANDGTIAGTKTVVIEEAIFKNENFVQGTHYTVDHVPAGLTLNVIRESDTQVVLRLDGAAVAHASANSISNLTITFTDNAFVGVKASGFGGTQTKNNMQVNFIDSNPIRILEVYPSAIVATSGTSQDGDFKNAQSAATSIESTTNNRYTVDSISLNSFISLKDDLSGNYDIIYFGRGNYCRNDVNSNVYGNDINVLCANKVIDFIKAGQLCIFHPDAFKANSLDGNVKTIMMTKFNDNTEINNLGNFVKLSSLGLASDNSNLSTVLQTAIKKYGTDEAINTSPVLSIYDQPLSYKTLDTPLDSMIIKYYFRANDKEDDKVTANLYIDFNKDNIFDSNDIIETKSIIKDGYGSIMYRMPASYSGVYYWKLELVDSKGAKDEVTDLFFIKGNEIQVKVLQIMPPGNNGDLVAMLNTPLPNHPGDTYGHKVGEYNVVVTQTTASDFNSPPTGDTKNLRNLNGNYNMLVIGFDDEYGPYNFNTDACDRIYTFLQTGQSVMFTHDLVAYATYQPNWNIRSYKPKNLITGVVSPIDFMTIIGQTTAVSAGQVDRDDNENRHWGSTLVNNYKLSNYYNVTVLPSTLTTLVKQVNSSAITRYPFNLENTAQTDMKVAGTHVQYYKLNLENPTIIPLYNLYRTDITGRVADDAMNNYYTYTKDNITYSGTGHSGNYPDYEVRLFVNTIIKSYDNANQPPSIIVDSPENNAMIDKDEPNVPLTFKVLDPNSTDKILTYKVSTDIDNNTYSNTIKNGESITINVSKGSIVGLVKTFIIKIEAWDDNTPIKAAAESIILTLDNVATPLVKPVINVNNTYLVGQRINMDVQLLATGTVANDVTIAPKLTLKAPIGLSYNGNNDGCSKEYSLSIDYAANVPMNATLPILPTKYDMNDILVSALPQDIPETKYTLEADTEFKLPNPDPLVDPNDWPLITSIEKKEITVRSASVAIEAVDNSGKYLTTYTINGMDTANLGKVVKKGGYYLNYDIAEGAHTYSIKLPAGYENEYADVQKWTEVSTGNWQWVTVDANITPDPVTKELSVTKNISFTDYQWKITFHLKLSDIVVKTPITYFKVVTPPYLKTVPKDIDKIGVDNGSGSTPLSLKIKKNSMVYLAAEFALEPIGGNRVVGLNVYVETKKSDNTNQTNSQNMASIVSSTTYPLLLLNNASADTGPLLNPQTINSISYPSPIRLDTQINNNPPDTQDPDNLTGPPIQTYAGNIYYVLLEIPEALIGDKVKITGIDLVMESGTIEHVATSFTRYVVFEDLNAPKRR